MASSGTLSLALDFKMKPRDRDDAFLTGHTRIKNVASIEAGDLELRTIRSFVAQAYSPRDVPGGHSAVYGSITSPGSLGNAVYLKTLKGTLTQANAPAVGTAHFGTVKGGTMTVGFWCVGA